MANTGALRSLTIVLTMFAAACASGAKTDTSRRDGAVVVDAGSDLGELDAAMPDEDGGVIDASSEPDAATSPDGGGGAQRCTPADAPTVCGGRPCVDGYCCDQLCDGVCRGCAVGDSEGTCVRHAAASDPESECAELAPTSCGTTGLCDGAGACALHPATSACDDGQACTSGDACDGAGMCRGDAPTACAPGMGNECCLGSCDAAGGCRTDPGSCSDTCGGNSLSVGKTCMGCGGARAAGSCLGGATQVCDATNHSLCQQVACGGTTYFCTSSGGSWAWRVAPVCDDGNACTHADSCGSGTCGGLPVTCTTTACATRACNGTATCTETLRTGLSCDDGNACSYGDSCSAAGVCTPTGTATCTSTTCVNRVCNGTASCTDMPRTGMSCDDGNACTTGDSCGMGGMCGGGTTVTCPAGTTCRGFVCDGSPSCAPMPRNLGGACDDGNPATTSDLCRADGSCLGSSCPATLSVAFSEDFAAPSATAWTSGTDATITTSRWKAYTSANHGLRINGGRLEITNARSSSAGHGQGYAYVKTGGTGAAYDTAIYNSTLRNNTGSSVVWTLNMRRDDPETTDGGFRCTSSSSQNDITVGLAYVLGSTTASGLNASASTCSPTGSTNGYAVVMGGSSARVRLVRFANGLRNGTITDIVTSGSYSPSNYFSVRVTYNATTDQWTLETRSDGGTTFGDPATGTYGFTGTGTDATYVSTPLDYSGPYFQTGCSGLCSSTYTTRFDNVRVGVRCAP